MVDLRTGALSPHDRGARCTKITAVGPASDRDADCPLWTRFLREITGGDAELQAYLQRAVGYCLTGSVREHALFFAHGSGGNGKGVFLNTVAAILGDYATVASMDSFTAITPTATRPIWRCCAAPGWSRAGDRGGPALGRAEVKALTGGDPITARFMRQDFFTYRPQFKLFVAGNHKPSLRNIDDAIRRRLHLIPFTFKPARPDRDLPEKLKPGWPAILTWAIQGCLEWQRVGLAPPRAVVEATAEYFAEEDAVGRWIDERCRRDANATATTHDLFADWRDWCAQTGEHVGTEKRFAQAVAQRGCERWRHPKTRKMGFRGNRAARRVRVRSRRGAGPRRMTMETRIERIERVGLSRAGGARKHRKDRSRAWRYWLGPAARPKRGAKASKGGVLLCTYARARVGDNESSVSKLSPFVQRPPPIRMLPSEERMAATYLAGPRRHPDQITLEGTIMAVSTLRAVRSEARAISMLAPALGRESGDERAGELLEQAAAVVARRRGTYGQPGNLFEHVARRWSLVPRRQGHARASRCSA